MNNSPTYSTTLSTITESDINKTAQVLTGRFKPLILDLRTKDKKSTKQGFFKGHNPVGAFINTGNR